MVQAVFEPQTKERRSKPRIDCSYPAIVQGLDARGRKFRTNATLTNLSANGLHLVLRSDIQPDNNLFVLFRCSRTGPLGKQKAPLIAVEGEIIRSERPGPGMHKLALKILHNRFL